MDPEIQFCAIMQVLSMRDDVPVRTLAALARANRTGYAYAQWRVAKYRAIYDKYLPRFGRRLHRRLIGHPINYTGHTATIEKFELMRGNWAVGCQLFNTGEVPFKPEWLLNNRVAIENVVLWTTKPVTLVALFIVHGIALTWRGIEPEDYEKINDNLYFVSLDVPTELNPILLGSAIVRHDEVYLSVSRSYSITETPHGESLSIIQDMDFMYENINRVVVSYATVPETSHNWRDYHVVYNGDIDNQWWRESFVQKKGWRRIDESQDQPPQMQIVGVVPRS